MFIWHKGAESLGLWRQLPLDIPDGGFRGSRRSHRVTTPTCRAAEDGTVPLPIICTVLLSEVKRMQVDSVTMALASETLRLTLGAYKRFRAEDAASIKRLRVKLNTLKQ